MSDGVSYFMPDAFVHSDIDIFVRFPVHLTYSCQSLSCRCSKAALANNFAVLDCVQNDKAAEDADLGPKCHHLIWSYKRNLTIDGRFEAIARTVCPELVEKCQQTVKMEATKGALLSCLMDYAEDENKNAECRAFLTRIEMVVFSDYRLMSNFAEKCSHDIDKFKCGRLDPDADTKGHTQGATIECLEQHASKLDQECRREILRVAELQSDDFHLDRALYFACRDDRERFCASVQSGDGRVYRCLLRQKSHRDMSETCREKLFQREMLVVHDYKVSKGLAKACKEDIRAYKCRADTSGRREIRLAQILLCLENAMQLGKPVQAGKSLTSMSYVCNRL